jgi:hypothetical protein
MSVTDLLAILSGTIRARRSPNAHSFRPPFQNNPDFPQDAERFESDVLYPENCRLSYCFSYLPYFFFKDLDLL